MNTAKTNFIPDTETDRYKNPTELKRQHSISETGIPFPALLRFVLGLWSVAVWLLLIALPGLLQSRSFNGFALHFPYVLIGLVILGGIGYALRALADGHLLWFSSVLFLLGTWM